MGENSTCKAPSSCTEVELEEFEALVRRGFPFADGRLPGRIRKSAWLASSHAADGELVGVAALKVRTEEYRRDLFVKAGVPDGHCDYGLELGWVFVAPSHRQSGIAGRLCRVLMERAQACGVFSTTRTDNEFMSRILLSIGFERTGKPYLYRGEELQLFLRAQISRDE